MGNDTFRDNAPIPNFGKFTKLNVYRSSLPFVEFGGVQGLGRLGGIGLCLGLRNDIDKMLLVISSAPPSVPCFYIIPQNRTFVNSLIY